MSPPQHCCFVCCACYSSSFPCTCRSTDELGRPRTVMLIVPITSILSGGGETVVSERCGWRAVGRSKRHRRSCSGREGSSSSSSSSVRSGSRRSSSSHVLIEGRAWLGWCWEVGGVQLGAKAYHLCFVLTALKDVGQDK